MGAFFCGCKRMPERFHIGAATVCGAMPVMAMALLLQPWWLPSGVSPYDYARWVEAGFLVSMTIMAALQKGVIREALGPWLLPYFTFCALTVLVSLFAETGLPSWVSGLRAVVWVAVLMVTIHAFQVVTGRGRAALAVSLTAILAIHVFYSLTGMLVLLANDVPGTGFIVSAFSNINHAAAFYTLCLLILPGLSSQISSNARSWPAFFMVTGAGLVVLIISIGARGSFMGASLAVCAVGLFAGRESFAYLKKIAIYVCLGVTAYFFIKWASPGYEMQGKGLFHDSGRLMLWSVAWKGFLEAPFLGHGPLSYAMNVSLPVTHPHNLVLSMLYEYGLPVVALAVWVALDMLRLMWRGRQCFRNDILALSGLAAVVSFVAHSQVSGLAMIPATVIMFSLALAFCLRPLMEKQAEGASSKVGMGLPALGIVIAAFYLFLVMLYWNALPSQGAAEPRFWLQGEIQPGRT